MEPICFIQNKKKGIMFWKMVLEKKPKKERDRKRTKPTNKKKNNSYNIKLI